MEKLKPSIRIYRADKSIPLPERKTGGSAGWDVYASEETLLMPGIVTLVPTGLIIETPPGYHFRVFIRSGFAVRNNVSLVNSVGIIDADYCGPDDYLKIAMVKHAVPGIEPTTIAKGERIAQIIFERNTFDSVFWQEQENADFHGNSRGGFGSTGKL
jgi:dUTP pyrophosphatase